jgi:VWFA-related protein
MVAPGRKSTCLYGLTTSVGAPATLLAITCLLAQAGLARPQTGGQKSDQSEISSHETQPAFRLRVERNLVIVRVVIRDSKGHAVGDLRKEDFTLFDSGKPQIISGFAVERPSAPAVTVQAPARKEAKPAPVPETPAAPSVPQRFVALYFDDLHMGIQDVGRSRAAADRYLASALGPKDRVAIFTSSGIGELEFTNDRAKLHAALFLLRRRAKTLPTMANTCPQIGEYQAYLIAQLHRGDATGIATAEASNCGPSAGSEGPAGTSTPRMMQPAAPTGGSAAERVADLEARQVWQLADLQSTNALDKLAQVVRRLAAMPGQRNLVLVSSGFLAATHQPEVEQIIDRALRSSVVINALDAKGLYPYVAREGNPTPYNLTGSVGLEAAKSLMENEGLTVVRQVMGTLAAATGGTFFTNSNDLDEGFRTVGALPEVYYALTFTPQDLKADGKFHTLKVDVKSSEPLTVQARRGYFAPGPHGGAGEKPSQAAAEIENAIFSQEESHQLPAEVRTEYAKVNEQEAALTVFVHLDMRALRFRKEEGRNLNTLTFATALFDKDGQYVTGNERVLELRLKDETLEKLAQPGFTVGAKLKVRPGTYRLREVVRDAEGGQISALNCPVEIAF